MSCFFFVKHYKGEKKKKRFKKTKFPKHVEKTFFFLKKSTNKETGKNEIF